MRLLSVVLNVVMVASLIAGPVHVNQVGYYPYAKKIASIPDSSTAFFSIIDAGTQEVVFNGNLVPAGFDKTAEEYVSIADFTSLSEEGNYQLILDGKELSFQFSISSFCYREALNTVLKSYYYLRSGMALSDKNAGLWYRDAGHLGDSLLRVYDLPINSSYDVRGGWYDAGDFGKYVVNAGITCGTLMELYELDPEIIDDSSLNIPESRNQKSDLLDEVKYELDWLIRMQDDDGGVFFKVGPVEWYGTIMPADDESERFIIGKSTTSTLDFAAVMAMAGRVYKDYDSDFAQECITRSQKAWQWAVANPDSAYPKNTGGTGPYEDGSDNTYKDEFLWALTELGITTGKSVYLDTLEKLIFNNKISSTAWWQDVKNLAFYSLAINAVLSDSADNHVKNQIISYADKAVASIAKSPYRNPLKKDNYSWGSNGNCGNYGVILAYAHFLTGEQKYLDALVLTTDYLFGRNPIGFSYVTGIGRDTPFSPHHRQSQADQIEAPVPGFVVGGANCFADGVDEYLLEIIESQTPPAKCYIDIYDSWASNENAINQNAPWVLVLAYLEKTAMDNRAVFSKKRFIHNTEKISSLKIKPEKGGIRIFCDANRGLETLSLFNIQGKQIAKKSINKGEKTVFFSSGITGSSPLILQIQSKSGVDYHKLLLIK